MEEVTRPVAYNASNPTVGSQALARTQAHIYTNEQTDKHYVVTNVVIHTLRIYTNSWQCY